MKKNWKRKIPLIILLATAGAAAFSGLVMLLWNGILPSLFHVSIITFWQAAGLLLLARLLFGGFRGRRHRMMGGCHGGHRNWQHGGNCEPKMATAE